jgi:hypothetical protein
MSMASLEWVFREGRFGAAKAVFYGGLAVGVLDAIDAFVFFGFIRGARMLSIFQAVAGGLLGREAAFQGGVPTFAFGLLLHFFIALAVALVYYLASRKLPELTRRPLLWGALYGVAVFFFMQKAVIPLSRLGPGKMALPGLLNGVIGHALMVGIPAAVFARMGPPAAGSQ